MTQETAKLKQTLRELIEVIMEPGLYNFLTDSERTKVSTIIQQALACETAQS